MSLDESLVSGLKQFAEGDMSADEWRAWWEENAALVKRQVKPGEFLRMKPRKQDPIPTRAICKSHKGVCQALEAREMPFTMTDRFEISHDQQVTKIYGTPELEPIRHLSYSTVSPVSETATHGIKAEAGDLNANGNWWCEGVNFSDNENDRLFGETKLFLIGYSTANGQYVEVDPEEDLTMVRRDLDILVQQLERWSSNYLLSWNLHLGARIVGMISDDQANTGIREFLDSIASQVGPERTKLISEKYASRWV